jgi:hypothetical protein
MTAKNNLYVNVKIRSVKNRVRCASGLASSSTLKREAQGIGSFQTITRIRSPVSVQL